jgi:hypothetical protein
MGDFVEGELYLIMDSIVSYPIQYILFLFLFIFLFKVKYGGHCLGMVTKGVTSSASHRPGMPLLKCFT